MSMDTVGAVIGIAVGAGVVIWFLTKIVIPAWVDTRRDERIALTGERADATIVEIEHTNATMTGIRYGVKITFELEVAGKKTTTVVEHFVSAEELETLKPGGPIPVRYDRANPSLCVIALPRTA